MTKRVAVELNKVNTLIALGSMYRNATDAIKEYVSNAIDEWSVARQKQGFEGPCQVEFRLARDSVTIDYNSPGMDEKGFEEALKHVVDSPKGHLGIPQIGNLGIGLWAFNQIGTKVTFYSKGSGSAPPITVTLRRESQEAEFEDPKPGQSRQTPGMTIRITGLFQDPTKPYASLAPDKLRRSLAERFDAYLRSEQLKIRIICGERTLEVEPLRLDLPSVGEGFQEVALTSDPTKRFRTQFWFDPSGNGKVSIRHTGVVILDDLRLIQESGLNDTLYSSGFIRGFVDADFLKPLPARAQFLENQDWVELMMELAKIAPELEKEINSHRESVEAERRVSLLLRAQRIAREVLSEEEFLDLQLIRGFSRVRVKPDGAPVGEPTPRNGNGHNGHNGKDGQAGRRRTRHIIVRPIAFEGDLLRHSRLSDQGVEINVNSPDFLALSQLPRARQVAYIAMLLGKEIIAYNDNSRVSDPLLEKMVAYELKVLQRVWR